MFVCVKAMVLEAGEPRRLEGGLEKGRGVEEAKGSSELPDSEPSQFLMTLQRNIFQVTASINSWGVIK